MFLTTGSENHIFAENVYGSENHIFQAPLIHLHLSITFHLICIPLLCWNLPKMYDFTILCKGFIWHFSNQLTKPSKSSCSLSLSFLLFSTTHHLEMTLSWYIGSMSNYIYLAVWIDAFTTVMTIWHRTNS